MLAPQHDPAAFISKWRHVELKERSAAQEHFLDLCRLVAHPTANDGRHFGLFHLAAVPHGDKDLAASRPEVMTPMRAALKRWMDQRVESSIVEIFPAGEP